MLKIETTSVFREVRVFVSYYYNTPTCTPQDKTQMVFEGFYIGSINE